ncbi:MAG: hypothetical protein UY56_C0004G0018 [Parcubacteria group bacterium GW2011_GWA1_50_14]|nr:MAG: hypothetical protein UY56_C0004G0018 [Parcubacteria group bacterium GW2011_GWA1_50_14]
MSGAMFRERKQDRNFSSGLQTMQALFLFSVMYILILMFSRTLE